MPIMFNSILEAAKIDPKMVRLLRHQDKRADRDKTPYSLWRERPDDFVTYQARQSSFREKTFGSAHFWAVFVATPAGETLFAGLYGVGPSRPGDPLDGATAAAREGPFATRL